MKKECPDIFKVRVDQVQTACGWGVAFLVLMMCNLRTPAQDHEALDNLNKLVRDAHTKARTIVLEKSGPIIIVDFDKLILIHKGVRIEEAAVPIIYHRLKAVAHAPMGVYLLLADVVDGPLTEAQLAALQQLREAIRAANEALTEKIFTGEQMDRQKKILTMSQDFLDGVIKAKKCTQDELVAYTRKTRPLFMLNAEEAAAVQILGYDGVVAIWKSKLTAEEWGTLRVAVMGTALPRKENLAVQYFARVLGESGEGKRLIYAESMFDEQKILRFISTSEVDARMAKAIFDDPTRLHRDLLSEAAAKFLKENEGKLKALATQKK
jgi:hypothetical protein